MILFVYGTLLPGLCRYPMISSSKHLGPASTDGILYDLGEYPGLKKGKGVIQGQLFKVDESTLQALDKEEGYYPLDTKHSEYLREEITVTFQNSSKKVQTYIYAGDTTNMKIIRSGDYLNYISQNSR